MVQNQIHQYRHGEAASRYIIYSFEKPRTLTRRRALWAWQRETGDLKRALAYARTLLSRGSYERVEVKRHRYDNRRQHLDVSTCCVLKSSAIFPGFPAAFALWRRRFADFLNR